jgi:hypothetical protein
LIAGLLAAGEFDLRLARFEEPLIATAPTSPSLVWMISGRSARSCPTLLTNLGLAYYRAGYFSKAIDSWEQAWRTGRDVTEIHGKALVDRAFGELLRMHALGHAARLEALFRELGEPAGDWPRRR